MSNKTAKTEDTPNYHRMMDEVIEKKDRIPEYEPLFLACQDRSALIYLFLYADYGVHGRWLEAEPRILEDADTAIQYARYVVKGRWPEAELIILENEKKTADYIKLLRDLGLEQDVAEFMLKC